MKRNYHSLFAFFLLFIIINYYYYDYYKEGGVRAPCTPLCALSYRCVLAVSALLSHLALRFQESVAIPLMHICFWDSANAYRFRCNFSNALEYCKRRVYLFLLLLLEFLFGGCFSLT